MRATCFIVLGISVILAGCNTTEDRINEHRAEFSALDPAKQQEVRSGHVEPGFTPDMVYMALGKPTQVTNGPDATLVWLYHREPVTAYNETIRAGFRQRIVYDPVKRTNDVITEPIDTKAFPNLVPYTLRLTFKDNHLVTLERISSP